MKTLGVLFPLMAGGVAAAGWAVDRTRPADHGSPAAEAAVQSSQMSRTELQRSDLTGTDMEVIVGITEVPVGATLPRHVHAGEEAYYILQGGTIRAPGGEPTVMGTGGSGVNVRDVPHAGFEVIGDSTVRFLTVHVVDKGRPLSSPAR